MAKWTIKTIGRVTAEDWSSWDRINRGAFGDHPALQSRMTRLLVEHFGDDALLFATFRGDSSPAGHAIVQRGRAGRWSVFCPPQSPMAQIVIRADSVTEQDAVGSLLRALPGAAWSLFLPLQDLPFSTVPAHQGRCVETKYWGTTVNVDLSQGFDDYWGRRPADLRSNIRRYLSRIAGEGHSLELRRASTAPELAAAVDRYGELESTGWKGREGTAVHPDNAQGHFFRDLLTAFCHQHAASVYELYLDSRLIASHMMISGGPMTVMLKTTHAEEVKRYAPGRMLLYMTLKDLQHQDARIIEFYTRANTEMKIWASQSRQILDVSLYRNSLIGAAVRHVRRRTAPDCSAGR